jgi:hypothetical protein
MERTLRTGTMVLLCVLPWRRLLGLAGVEDVRGLPFGGHLNVDADCRCNVG